MTYSKISNLIKTALECDNNTNDLKLNVDGDILKIIVNYINLKKGSTDWEIKTLVNETITEALPSNLKWEGNFIDNIDITYEKDKDKHRRNRDDE
jgi:hypothetical protein